MQQFTSYERVLVVHTQLAFLGSLENISFTDILFRKNVLFVLIRKLYQEEINKKAQKLCPSVQNVGHIYVLPDTLKHIIPE